MGILLIRTNIYKRKSSKGTVSWMVRWKCPKTGRWKALTGGRTQSEAKLVEAQIRRELALGNVPDPHRTIKKVTINETACDYFKSSEFLGLSQGYQRIAKRQIETVLLKSCGHYPFEEIDRDLILGLYRKLKDQGLTNNTLKKYHYAFSKLCQYYGSYHPEFRNPFRQITDLSKMFPVQEPTRDINFLTQEELQTLLTEAKRSKNELLYPFLKFLAFTGLRRSEALRLKWTDIDQATGFIHVRKSKSRKPRVIPIEAEAWSAIELLKGNGEKVFTRKNGKTCDEGAFLKPLKRIAQRVGIAKRIDLHTFRHSYGSNKIRAGWGLKKVSVLLGHSDISITANIYSHLLDGDLKVRDEMDAGSLSPQAAQMIAESVARLLKKGGA